MHCGPPNQNFGWAMAHPAHAAAPPMDAGNSAELFSYFGAILCQTLPTTNNHLAGMVRNKSDAWASIRSPFHFHFPSHPCISVKLLS